MTKRTTAVRRPRLRGELSRVLAHHIDTTDVQACADLLDALVQVYDSYLRLAVEEEARQLLLAAEESAAGVALGVDTSSNGCPSTAV